MTNYGVAIYGQSVYGASDSNQLPYSVSPLTLTVLYPTNVVVNWQVPSGNYLGLRLVRNQNSLPETQEDGVIVWEQYSSAISKTSFNDGGGIEDTSGIPITPGRPIYYNMFLLTNTNLWVSAGAETAVMPSDHGLSEALIRSLPTVFTSADQNPISEPDYTSDLYQFLDGFAFTLDESMTLIDLILPDSTRTNSPIGLIPIETYNYGLTLEPGMSIKSQKQLIREAIYMYTHKGTYDGLETFVASLTNYSPTITTSSNLMLNVQDSTFYQSTGNWIATSTGTITSSTDMAPVATLTNNYIDLNYSCKIVATGAGSMTLGADSPILKGVPIVPGTQYTLSAQVISPPSSGTVTPSIIFYDRLGNQINSPISGSGVATNDTWKHIVQTATAPQFYQSYVASAVGASGTITYTTPSPHSFTNGEHITIVGFSTAGFNLTNVQITSVPSTTTFTVANSFTGTSTSSESGIAYPAPVNKDSTYAGITFSWSAAGTYYIDCVCFQAGATAAYDEARAIDVFLNPNKTNNILNPSFETNVTDGWTLAGSATAAKSSTVPPDLYSGTSSAQITATGNWTYTSNRVPIAAGKYLTGSAYVKSSSALTVSLTARDTSGTIVDNDVYPQGVNSSWTRVSVTDLVDAFDTTTYTYELVFSGGAGTFYIDGVQFESSFRFTPTVLETLTPATNNATLSDLVVNVGSGTAFYINPAFNSSNLTYTLLVPENIGTVTVTPTASDPASTILVNGTAVASGATSGSISVQPSQSTQIQIRVTTATGTVQTYTLLTALPKFSATDYFDGSLPEQYGAEWGGTANNSASYLYVNKPAKVVALGKAITDWIPMNAFWRVRTYAGVEYNNLTV